MNYKMSVRRWLGVLLVVFVGGFLLIWNFGAVSEAGKRSLFAPNLTATKTVGFAAGGDADGDGKADPGDVLQYSVTINNTGSDATGVTLNDTLSAITSLSGTANIVPIARNDAYNTIGNVNLAIPAANSLLSNDSEFDGGTLTVTGFGNTSGTANGTAPNTNLTTTNGGTLNVQADGTFAYNPARGFTGTDTFYYTVSDGQGGSTTASATVTIAGKIWFINNAAGACSASCDGRLTNPYVSTTAFQTNNNGASPNPAAGDFIFVYTGGSTYNGSLTLLNNQKLIGQGASQTILAITGFTTPSGTNQLPGTGASPTLGTTAAAANAITIAQNANATIRGLNVGSTTGAKIITSPAPPSSAFGTLTISEVGLSGTGQALNLDNGTLAATFTSINTTSSASQGISLESVAGSLTVTGGTTLAGNTTQCILVTASTANISFGNTSCSGGTDGVSLQNNSSGTRTFGTLNVAGGSGIAFLHANGGGNATVSGAATLSSANAAVSVNTPSAANAINFQAATSATVTGVGNNGVEWIGTAGAAITFNSLSIQSNGGNALVAIIGGTFNVTNGTGIINSSSQPAPAIIASSIALNANFSAINSSGGGTSGVSLTNVTGTSNFGTGSLSSGVFSLPCFRVSGGNANVVYNGTLTQTTAAQVVDIQNAVGGTITLGGLITSNNGTGRGILLNSNSGTTINFTGGLNLSTATNAAFTATGGGTINATQNNTTIVNTLTTTTGAALTVQNTTIGASGLTFRSINSNGGTNNGVTLDTTGAGNFTVTGTGSAGTGGTIQNKNGTDGQAASNGTGIYLNSVSGAVSLSYMSIQGCQNYGIRGITVSGGMTIDNTNIGTVTKNGTTYTTDAEAVTALQGEASLRFRNLTGTVNFTNDSFDRGFGRTVHIHNSDVGSTLTLNITNSTLRQSLNNTNGGDTGGNSTDALTIQAINNATVNLNISNSHFTAYRQFGILTDMRDTATLIAEVANSDFSNDNTGNVGASCSINFGGGGATATDVLIKYYVHDNTFRHGSVATGTPNNGGAHIVSGGVSGGVKADGKIINNTFGVSGVVGSGAGGAADVLRLFASGNNAATTRVTGSTHTRYLVQNNIIQRYGEVGIQFNARQGNSTIDATVLGNTIREPGTAALGAFGAIWVNSGALASDTNQVNIAIGGTNAADKNTMTNSDPSNATDVFLDKNTCAGCASTLNLYRNGSTASGSGEALIRQILVDDNNPTLDLLNGFTGGTIGTPNGLPSQPSARPANVDETIKTTVKLSDTFNVHNAFYQSPLETADFRKIFDSLPLTKETILTRLVTTNDAKISASGEADAKIILVENKEKSSNAPNYLFRINAFVGDAFGFISEAADKLGTAISPTVVAQSKDGTSAPEAGETVTKGPFTLQAGESVTIQFNAAVENGPFAAGINNVTNTAQISGSNFTTFNSSTSSIALDAAPDLSVTNSDGAATTQPGGIVAYTLSYGNSNAVNAQNATGVTLTETVPANTTFNAAASSAGWSCADGSAAGTVCTQTIGAFAAGASGSKVFAVRVLDALPATALQISDTATIADDAANGTDLNPPNNTGNDTTNIIGVWLGTTSVDWNTATNWSNAVVPPSGNNVSIPSGGGANAPTVVSADVSLNNLVLNGKNLTLNANRTLTVSGATTLGSNLVDGVGTLALDATATAISRTTGQVQSILKKTFAANGAFVFAVGTNSTQYSPVNVNVTASTGDLSVQAKSGVAPAVPALDTTKTLRRYWTLNGSGITADVTFNYLSGDVFGNENNYRVIRVSGSTAIAMPNGVPCPGGGSPCVDPAANTIFVGGLNSFSDWTAGELAPTAAVAGIEGRIVDANGRGLRKVVVMLSGGNLTEPKVALTDWTGRYYFEDVPVGATYILTPKSGRYQFAPASRVQSVNDNLANIDFVGGRQSP